MRIYKLNDHYIDLDHVLMVTDLIWWTTESDTHDEAWFYITFAFREKRKRFSFSWDQSDFSEQRWEAEREKIKQEYDNFLNAWQNK